MFDIQPPARPAHNHASSPLDHLPITVLRLTLETTAPFTGPSFKGPLFRSALGATLRAQECVTALPTCPGCPALASCFYARAFETPSPEAPLRHQDSFGPHPFLLIPPLDYRTQVPAGVRWEAHLVLYGQAGPAASRLLAAIRSFGAAGRWGGPFRILQAVPASLWTTSPVVPRAVRLDFVSPLRLRVKGVYLSRPPFHEIVRALLRRLHLLASLYAAVRPEPGWALEILRTAESVRLRDHGWRTHASARRSGRQNRVIPMDGQLGGLTVEGDLAPLMDFLRGGQWTGVGSATSQGYGIYRLSSVSGRDPM